MVSFPGVMGRDYARIATVPADDGCVSTTHEVTELVYLPGGAIPKET